MIKSLREKYISEFTQSKYEDFVKDMNSEFDYKIDFRIAETPIFLPKHLMNEISNAAEEFTTALQSKEFKEFSKGGLPRQLEVPNEDEHTSLLAIDFAICKDENGNFIPQLIELQGFASLYCYQELLNIKMRTHFDIGDNLNTHFNGLNPNSYMKIVKDTIVGDSDPENVILLDIAPEKQKTYIDFLCTEKYISVKPLCITKVKREGKKLFYDNNGKKTPIEKIYNRVIYDELAKRSDIKYDFRFSEELDVKWVAHPNWFFKISKYSIPFFKNKYVPKTDFLSDVKEIPEDLENYVLKPLYSFAGAGVIFDLKKEDLVAIPEDKKKDYILQRKVNYEPSIVTPDIPAKAELRLLFVWNDKPQLIHNLVRLSKGKMMGVDFNKNQTWVGSSIAYHEELS